MMQLTVNQLSKNIHGKQVLAALSFAWRPGEIIGLVGRNGAGKTTLMRTMVNQYVPDGGYLELDGQPLASHPEARPQLIYLDPANEFFRRYTLKRLADFYSLVYPRFDQTRYFKLLATNGLPPAKRFRELSKGYQAVVVLALTLASNAPFMLLDEPFDGLDLFIRETIVKLVIAEVADGKRSFLIASHNLAELDGLADRILFIKDNTISHDVQLEDYREHAMKRQLVFPTKGIPAVVQQYGTILAIRGRVIEALFPDYTPAVQAAIAAEKPVLDEPLLLSLTDMFRSELAPTKEAQHA